MSVKTLLNKIRKTTGSMSFEESKLGMISGYINTGSYAVNRIISGSIHKGIPNGRVVIVAGESQSGKSLLAAECAANALKAGYDIVFYFDSEGGALRDFFKGRGCDLSRIEHVPLESVEDATVKILNTYSGLKDEKLENPNFRALCILDSLGGLVPSKLITDAEKGKQVSEMGNRAKLCNNLMKGLTMPALISDVPIIVINHTYANPAEMFASKVKQQGGGEGVKYMSTITIQCDKKLERFDKSVGEEKDKECFFKGSWLKYFSVKNRIVKPGYEAEVFIDFDRGFGKYEGLLESAIRYGFIKDNEVKSGYYTVPSWKPEVLIRKSDNSIFTDEYEEAWKSFLEDYDKRSQEELTYSRKEMEEQIEEVKSDIGE